MAQGERHPSSRKSIRQTFGSVNSRKSGRTQSDRRQVRTGQNSLRFESNQSPLDGNKRIMDCRHLFSAEPRQVGGGGTAMHNPENDAKFNSTVSNNDNKGKK